MFSPAADLQAHIAKLSELCPEFCKLVQLETGLVCKLDKNVNTRSVKDKLLSFKGQQ